MSKYKIKIDWEYEVEADDEENAMEVFGEQIERDLAVQNTTFENELFNAATVEKVNENEN